MSYSLREDSPVKCHKRLSSTQPIRLMPMKLGGLQIAVYVTVPDPRKSGIKLLNASQSPFISSLVVLQYRLSKLN